MRTLNQNIYETLLNELEDHDPMELFRSMATSQSVVAMDQGFDGDDELAHKFQLFSDFWKQFESISTLLDNAEFSAESGQVFVDLPSIANLICSCYERFLKLWYLSQPAGFLGVPEADALWFKWLCYRYSPYHDKRITRKLVAPVIESEEVLDSMVKEEQQWCDVLELIKSHPLFSTLNKATQKAIEHNGEWKIGNRKVLSWSGLLALSPLNCADVEFEYHQLKVYTSGGLGNEDLEKTLNGNSIAIDNLEKSLRRLAAVYISLFDDIFPGSDAVFTLHELACVRWELELLEGLAEEPALGVDTV